MSRRRRWGEERRKAMESVVKYAEGIFNKNVVTKNLFYYRCLVKKHFVKYPNMQNLFKILIKNSIAKVVVRTLSDICDGAFFRK